MMIVSPPSTSSSSWGRWVLASEADRPDRAQHRGGVAMGQCAADADTLGGDGDTPFQQNAQALDQGDGPIRQIGQGTLPDPAFSHESTRATGWPAVNCDWAPIRYTWRHFIDSIRHKKNSSVLHGYKVSR
jgi:hypothetical protein